MSSLSLPPNLNGIKHYLQMADDYDELALPISYWCRLFALKQGVKLQKAKEDVIFLNDLMKCLQTFKKQKGLFQKDILNETDAQHHIRSVANHLLDWADSENINLENHNNKNFIVKAYYSACMLFNVCSVFGNLNEEISSKAKHAKCMAAASLQNLLNQDVRSSSGDTLNRDKEVINMENTGLEYLIAEGTNDETKPDVVVQLVERFVKSLLTSSPKEEKKDRDKVGTEEMLKTVRRCLNLLTPSNFEKILARIQALDINSEDQLARVAKLFFEKAINNDPLCFMYAKKLPETQEPEQVLVAPPPQPLCQPRESSVTSARAASSSALPIVVNANTDIPTDAEEGPLDLSKQTPPIPHESLPPASSGVNQQLVVANSGPIQDRLAQGNRQFFGRPIRPGNQHSPRPPMSGGTINPNAPQALPYPGLNQPVLFVIGDQFNQRSPYLPYPANAPEYYPTLGNQPSGKVLNKFQQQPQAALQSYGYKQTSRYPGRYPGPPPVSPAFYYQPQQLQQQFQKEPQVSVALPKSPSRKATSIGLTFVDPNTNKDVLTGEEVLPSTAVTPTTATPSDVVATDLLLLQDKPSLNVATPLSVTSTDDGESRAQEGKKATEEDDSDFLLELQNNPASQTKPEGLPSLKVVFDEVFPEEQFIVSAKRNSQERIAVHFPTVHFPPVVEPYYLTMYAKMCQALSTKEVTSASDPAETTNFRKVLLTLCQKEFEKDSTGLVDVENKKKEIESAETEVKKQELEFELELLVYSNRKKSLRTIRFFGELFKLRILSARIMHQCILRCLGQPDDEDSLERLCTLLSAIGKKLDVPLQAPAGRSTSISTNRETMNSYFSTLDAIVKQRKISNRIRFMIQDVVDLRKTGWKPRREDNNPKTIDQIHREVHKKRKEQERELNNPQFQRPMGSMGGLSRDGRMGDRRGGDDRNRKQSRPSDDGWNSVQNSGGRGSNVKLDMKQLRISKASGDADQTVISLGPGGKGMTSLGRGASDGMSQSMIGGVGGVASQDTRPNRYQILEDDSGTQHESGKAPSAGRSGLGDMNALLDSLRSQISGFSGLFPSLQSVSYPIRETTQPPTLSNQVSKDVLLGKSTVTEDEIERKSHSLLDEYFMNEKMEDAVLDMKEWLHASTVARFINQCLLYVLERNRKERRATGTLLKEMVKRKLFNSSDILHGFTGLLQSAKDLIVDIPKLWEYMAELVEPLFEEGVINVNFLPQFSSILNSSMVANFVGAVLNEFVRAKGAAGADRTLAMWKAPLPRVLPSFNDPNAFFAQHKELGSVSKSDSIPRTSGGVGKSSSSATPASQVDIDFQHSLEKYLRDANHLTTDDVCNWIQKQYVGDVNPAFIRALVTAVTESSIEGRGTDSKLNNTLLKHWTEVLRRYVDNIADRELQLLYAVQALVTQRQHPKGLIQGIFETLYDSNVVSEEGFESWVSDDDPLEREGKAMALKMITSFLTWLKEADPESDREVDA